MRQSRSVGIRECEPTLLAWMFGSTVTVAVGLAPAAGAGLVSGLAAGLAMMDALCSCQVKVEQMIIPGQAKAQACGYLYAAVRVTRAADAVELGTVTGQGSWSCA